MATSKTGRETTATPQVQKKGRTGDRSKAASEGKSRGSTRRSAKASGAKSESKQAILVERLCRRSGAGIADLGKTLGWLPHTVRAALTGLRKKGFTVTRSKSAQGLSVYRATPPVPTAAKPKSSTKAAETGAAG